MRSRPSRRRPRSTSRVPWPRSVGARPSWAGRSGSRPGTCAIRAGPGAVRGVAGSSPTRRGSPARSAPARAPGRAPRRGDRDPGPRPTIRPVRSWSGPYTAAMRAVGLPRSRPDRYIVLGDDNFLHVHRLSGRSRDRGGRGRPARDRGTGPYSPRTAASSASGRARRITSSGTSRRARSPPPGRPTPAACAIAPMASRWPSCGPTASCTSTTCRR